MMAFIRNRNAWQMYIFMSLIRAYCSWWWLISEVEMPSIDTYLYIWSVPTSVDDDLYVIFYFNEILLCENWRKLGAAKLWFYPFSKIRRHHFYGQWNLFYGISWFIFLLIKRFHWAEQKSIKNNYLKILCSGDTSPRKLCKILNSNLRISQINSYL